MRKFYGGLWVGGDLSVYRNRLEFSANELNRRYHIGILDLSIPFESIRAVRPRSGWITGIFDVVTDTGQTSFRCYGSEEFSATIVSAVEATARPS